MMARTGKTEGRWPEDQRAKFTNLWKEKSPPMNEERENQKKLVDYIKKLAEEKKELSNTPVITSKEYKKYTKENNIRACHSCFSQGCLARTQAAKALGLTYNGSKTCKKTDRKNWTSSQSQ